MIKLNYLLTMVTCLLTFSFSFASDYNISKIKSCTSAEQETLTNDYKLAVNYVSKMKEQIKQYASLEIKSSLKQKKIKNISRMIKCMDKKLKNNFEVRCRSIEHSVCGKRKQHAFVYHNINLFKNYFDTVNFCPIHFTFKDEYRAAVLTHEISHLCGTSDHKYFSWEENIGEIVTHVEKTIYTEDQKSGLRKTERKQVEIWDCNADTYLYWARKGLCIPGEDCD